MCVAIVVGVFLFPKPPVDEARRNSKQAGGKLPPGANKAGAVAADPAPNRPLPENGKLPPEDAANIAQAAIQS